MKQKPEDAPNIRPSSATSNHTLRPILSQIARPRTTNQQSKTVSFDMGRKEKQKRPPTPRFVSQLETIYEEEGEGDSCRVVEEKEPAVSCQKPSPLPSPDVRDEIIDLKKYVANSFHRIQRDHANTHRQVIYNFDLMQHKMQRAQKDIKELKGSRNMATPAGQRLVTEIISDFEQRGKK
jgi:hypothetical protein